VFQNLVPVSKPEVAEMTKLYENTQRMMCIAYVNEMSDACRQLSLASQTGKGTAIEIDPWEVANAAATKPFGYMPYYPSLGVGGHCIPVNPYYLLAGAEFPLLETCTKRMEDRPARMGDQLMETLTPKSNKRASILVVGMGFKKGQSVLSHSPGKALAVHLLSTYDVHVEFADPLVEQKAISFIPRFEDASWNEETLEKFDAIVVAVDQPGYDYELLDRLQATGTKVQWFTRR
jgi:nucleotide sugar dehydrogenase